MMPWIVRSNILPLASSGLHLTVTPFARLNPGGVLPLAIGMPAGLTLGISFLRWRRRRGIDVGASLANMLEGVRPDTFARQGSEGNAREGNDAVQ